MGTEVADLAVADESRAGVSVLTGNGNGAFQAAANYPAGNGPASVAVGDFNGDGIADLAVANLNGGTVSVLLGNGNGTFQAALTYPAGAGPNSVAVGDFNGDGKADLAVADQGGGVSVLAGSGDEGVPGGGELWRGSESAVSGWGTPTGTGGLTWRWPT